MVKTQDSLAELKSYYQNHEEKILESYFTFLKFKSISTDPSYKDELLNCCHWLKNYISDIGFETELWEGEGYPIIFAENLKAGPDKPTLLLYHHYDVQPVDPEEDWESAPFTPTVRDGKVFARGAQDNKGQSFYSVSALKAVSYTHL
ncbi:hypothetical protein AB751O23_BS_00040, partial [Chlamydiales bacterium SCGC AB-751-O23]